MEMEAVREQGNEHGLELVIGELGWSRAVARGELRIYVEAGGFEGTGDAGDQTGVV